VVRKKLPPGRLREIRRSGAATAASVYPFSIPAVSALKSLAIENVTFFAGENGSGKSTLIEAVAVRAGLNPEGGSRNLAFETRNTSSDLHAAIELVWSPQPARAFFLRAETFYNTATAYEGVGIGGYHERSHGESLLAAVEGQVFPGSFVVMDEPESALSVTGELKLMSAIREGVEQGSQYLIATHSPILLAYPGARIYELSDRGIEPVDYDDCAAVQLTRSFLNGPERFLRHLFGD
jgi:predicted ATPase